MVTSFAESPKRRRYFSARRAIREAGISSILLNPKLPVGLDLEARDAEGGLPVEVRHRKKPTQARFSPMCRAVVRAEN
jgi:hypothetical protein